MRLLRAAKNSTRKRLKELTPRSQEVHLLHLRRRGQGIPRRFHFS
jgi:hypothetical protein